MSRHHNQTPPSKDGPRTNRDIRVPKVRLVDENGDMKGVVPTADAVRMAADAGLDLVEVSPNADPPVCKILDYGKYKYEAQKKASQARKKQKTIEIKEVKLRPNIDTNDYNVKMRNVTRFLESGNKVKVTMRFRGREMAHQELGLDLLQKIADETTELGKLELRPKLEGRQMVMIIAPLGT